MLTASVVTYHTEPEELRRCLHSLLAAPALAWVTVVDNGREPRIADFLRSAFAAESASGRIRYRAAQNRGYGAGHNIALREAVAEGSPLHLVVNSDVRFGAGVLEHLTAYMEARPDVGQVIPAVRYPDGRPQAVCRLLPTPFDVFARRFLPAAWIRRRTERYTLAFTGYRTEMNPPYHMGCFMLLRTAALRSVAIIPGRSDAGRTHNGRDADDVHSGQPCADNAQEQYFDERFFLYPEDIDLTRRLHRRWRTMFCPDVSIVHDHRAASYHSLRLLWVHCANMCRYFGKWGWWHDAERTAFNRRLLDELRHAGYTTSGSTPS